MKTKSFLFIAVVLALLSCSKDESSTTPPSIGSIFGSVLNASSNSGLVGVQITTLPPTGSVLTGNTGSYSISSIPVGNYKVFASLSGYRSDTVNIAVSSGTTSQVDFRLIAVITGLVAYYPFNGNALDQSGNGNNGLVNGATLTQDRFGNMNSAYAFNGTTQFISIANSAGLNPSSAYTVHAWIRTSASHTNAGIIGKWNSYGGSYQGQYVLQAFKGGVNFIILTPTGQYQVTEPTYSDGFWHAFTGVWDGSTTAIYKDGILKSQIPCAGGIQTFNQALEIGRYAQGQGGAQNYFNGTIDDVRLYNRALTAQEIQTLYHEGGW